MKRSVLLALLVACDADPSVPATRTVVGHHDITFHTLDDAIVGEQAVDLHDTLVTAFYQDGDAWHIAPGLADREGHFSVADLPAEGHYWLRVARRPFGDTYFWTDADDVDFGEHVLGLPDPPRDYEGPMALVLDATGLAPWQDGDEIALYVPDDDVIQTVTSIVQANPPAVGDEAVNGLRYDWVGLPLAEVRSEEPAFVVQYSTQTAGEVAFHAPVRSFSPAAYAQQAGVDTQLSGAFTTPPAIDYRLTWKRSAFEALRPAIHPTHAGASVAHSFGVAAAPSARDEDYWISVEYPWLTLGDPSILEGTTDLDLGVLPVPNPFPESWLIGSFVTVFPVEVALPDGTLPARFEAAIGHRSRTRPTADAPAAPVLSPVGAPTIAGRDLFVDQTGVGTTPTLAWQPPAIGEPTSVQITLAQAIPEPPGNFPPGWYAAAVLVVPGDVHEVRLPPGVLREGEHYVLVIKAIRQVGQDVRVAPFRSYVEFAFAESVTSTFTP